MSRPRAAVRPPLSVPLARAGALALLVATNATAATIVQIGSVAGAPSTNAQVAVQVDTDAPCLGGFSATVTHSTALSLVSVSAEGAGCIADAVDAGAGSFQLGVTCTPSMADGATVARLVLAVGAGASGDLTISAGNVKASTCLGDSLAATATAGKVTTPVIGCVKGDVHPHDVGNGVVQLADFALARRKVVGSTPVVARDISCGDVHPNSIVCTPPLGPRNVCVTGNSIFQLGDLITIRRVVQGIYQFSCTACAPRLAPAEEWTPGDVAPRSGRDGVVDVADVVTLLRWSVGIEHPPEADLLRADLAPADVVAGTRRVQPRGNGRLDVSDAVIMLRAAVGLSTLEWPERSVAVRLDGAGSARVSALSAVVSGWPAWAAPSGHQAPACDESTGSGFDSVGPRWALTCAGDAVEAAPGSDLATLRYRGPRAVDVDDLELDLEALDESLDRLPIAARLVTP